MDIQGILKLLPHRYPFLMVDRMLEVEPAVRAVGIKCVTATEPHLAGHFPELPIMPGVLVLEHQAQVGGCMLLSHEHFRDTLMLLAGVEKARFRRKVVPGDVLKTETVLQKRKGNIGWVECTTTVNGELVCESVMMFAMERQPDRQDDQ